MKQLKQVPALEKAIAIFEYLEKNPNGATLSEISGTLKIAKSSAHGILATLTHHGYLSTKKNNLRFVLGTSLLPLALAAEKGIDLVRIATPYMAELRDTVEETVKISVKSKDSAVVIARLEAEKDYHASTKIGAHFPLHAGAAGKILLAHSTEYEMNRYVNSRLDRYTASTISDPVALRKELLLILERGYAEDNGERFEDIRALACPIFSHTEEAVAAISIAFLATPNVEQKKKELITHLFKCAREISQSLGSTVDSSYDS
jgi:DNA-binding IclR family transcriptional regulator